MKQLTFSGPDHKIGLYSIKELIVELKTLGEKKFTKTHPHPYLLLIYDTKDKADHISPFETLAVADPMDLTDTPLTGMKEIQKGAYIYLGSTGDLELIGPAAVEGLRNSVAYPITNSDRNSYNWMVTIGRAANNDIVVPHPLVSKMHATLKNENDHWIIEDTGSKNGTMLNQVRITKNEPKPLNNQDTVAFGAVSFVFLEIADFCKLIAKAT